MESTPLSLDPQSTALVLIDLQRGIVTRDTKPHTAADVVARSSKLANAFRAEHVEELRSIGWGVSAITRSAG